jgi:DmsE family decaheme c-type cytochrome
MRRKLWTGLTLSLSALALFLTGIGQHGLFSVPESEAASAMNSPCAECHETLAPSFDQTYHGRAWQGMNKDYSCQSCHGSTDKHVNDPSRQTIISFTKSGGRTPAELNKQCLECHSTTTLLSFWDNSAHSRNDIACVSCHTIHTGQAKVDELTACFTCHREKRGQINKRSHHPINEGKVTCSDCHNPHGTEAPHGMIKAENVNQLCYQCHPDKRGPYVYEHPPVEENCAICHTPHGSRHAKLLVEKVPNLCQDCHDWQRHPGTPYDANTGFTGRSPSNRFFARSCLNCHGAIHGSTSFESHSFTR